MQIKANTVRLSSGYDMPLVGLGTWQAKPSVVGTAVLHAIKCGYRHIDCAAAYGNEEEIGRALKTAMEEFKIHRSELFITSKLWNTKHHPDDVEDSCRKSVRDLGLDYLDLYLIHWPTAFARSQVTMPKAMDGSILYDEDIHPTDTWHSMEKLVKEGLVRSIGLSNFNSIQIQDILDRGEIRPVVNQVERHAYFQQTSLLKFCVDKNIVMTAYAPLGSPCNPWAKKEDVRVLSDNTIKSIAKEHSKSASQILLRWQIEEGVVVIPKSVTLKHIEDNFNIFDFELSDADKKSISEMEKNHRIILPLVNGLPRDANHKHYPFNAAF